MTDWNLIRALAAIAETGSLTAAAERLKTTQPTVGRWLKQLEDELGVPLVIRHTRGVELTERGQKLAGLAMNVEGQVQAFYRAAQGAFGELSGTVRVAATEVVGVLVLTPIVSALRALYPRIDMELVLDNRSADLLRGEADIAVRMFRPRQLDLIARHVADVPTGFFASHSYIERRGSPAAVSELGKHDLIGFDSRGPFATLLAGADARLSGASFCFRTDGLIAQLEAARHGVGIAVLQRPIAARYPELCRVLPDEALPPLPVWLVMHPDVRSGAHVSAVFEHLATLLPVHLGAAASG